MGSQLSITKDLFNNPSDSILPQRIAAMNAHYVIPYKYKRYISWCFALFIAVLVISLFLIGATMFDKKVKYETIPKYDQYSFLREECKNMTDNVVPNDLYLTEYGHQFVETVHFRYSDGAHWMVLSVISLGFMMLIYPIISFINAVMLTFRDCYYTNYGGDPLFICRFCAIYQRYSSPNASHLSSVLDPNNLFNHKLSLFVSPNSMKRQKKEEMDHYNEGNEVENDGVDDYAANTLK